MENFFNLLLVIFIFETSTYQDLLLSNILICTLPLGAVHFIIFEFKIGGKLFQNKIINYDSICFIHFVARSCPFCSFKYGQKNQDKRKQILILSPKPPDNYITYHTLQNQLASFVLFFKGFQCVFLNIKCYFVQAFGHVIVEGVKNMTLFSFQSICISIQFKHGSQVNKSQNSSMFQMKIFCICVQYIKCEV